MSVAVAPEAGRQLLVDTIHQYIPETALAAYEERLTAPRDALRVELRRRFPERGDL